MCLFYGAFLAVLDGETFHANPHVAEVPRLAYFASLDRALFATLYRVQAHAGFVAVSSERAREPRPAAGYHGVDGGHGLVAGQPGVFGRYRGAVLVLAFHVAVALGRLPAVVPRVVLDDALLVDA